MMQVSGEKDRNLLSQHLFKERKIVLGVTGIHPFIHLRINPVRLGVAHDDAVCLPYVRGDAFEIFNLWRVNIRIELNISAQEPPAVREFQSEVTARLSRAPGREPTLRAEEARKRDETVVPIVIAGNGEDVRMLFSGPRGKSISVWLDETLIVLKTVSRRINFVAAEKKQISASGPGAFRLACFSVSVFKLARFFGDRASDCVGRVTAFAKVRHVINPDFIAPACLIYFTERASIVLEMIGVILNFGAATGGESFDETAI